MGWSEVTRVDKLSEPEEKIQTLFFVWDKIQYRSYPPSCHSLPQITNKLVGGTWMAFLNVCAEENIIILSLSLAAGLSLWQDCGYCCICDFLVCSLWGLLKGIVHLWVAGVSTFHLVPLQVPERMDEGHLRVVESPALMQHLCHHYVLMALRERETTVIHNNKYTSTCPALCTRPSNSGNRVNNSSYSSYSISVWDEREREKHHNTTATDKHQQHLKPLSVIQYVLSHRDRDTVNITFSSFFPLWWFRYMYNIVLTVCC